VNKRWMILSAVLLILFQGLLPSQYAQDIPTDAGKTDQLRHQFAVSLLRTLLRSLSSRLMARTRRGRPLKRIIQNTLTSLSQCIGSG
jgi:hypothetical protein